MAVAKRKREEEEEEDVEPPAAAGGDAPPGAGGHAWTEQAAPARWREALGAARQWLVLNCARGDLRILDGEARPWALYRSRTQGYLYYARPGHSPTADVSGLALRPRGPEPEPRELPALLVVRPPRKSAGRPPTRLVPGAAVARGSFAQVHLATDGEKTWAVKRALRARPSCSESVYRDEHFLRLLAGHRHVVTLLGSYLDEQRRPCLLLPPAAGDLAQLRPRTLPAFWQLADQLCRGLSYVHARGVVHLDLKPSNVLVYREEGAHHCLADFGSATRAGNALDDEKLYECTRPYRAPEIVFGAETAAWPSQDLWSLGALLWQTCPEGSGCPLLGAQNGVEQAALVLAVAGVSVDVLCSWRFSPQQASACCAAGTLPPYMPHPHEEGAAEEDAPPPALLRAALLRATPSERSLAPLLAVAASLGASSGRPRGPHAPEEQAQDAERRHPVDQI